MREHERTTPDERTILVESGVSATRNGEPYVQIVWGKNVVHMSPQDARAHALRILEAADAAESDAFVVAFFREKADLSLEKAALVLKDFREWRRQRPNR